MDNEEVEGQISVRTVEERLEILERERAEMRREALDKIEVVNALYREVESQRILTLQAQERHANAAAERDKAAAARDQAASAMYTQDVKSAIDHRESLKRALRSFAESAQRFVERYRARP